MGEVNRPAGLGVCVAPALAQVAPLPALAQLAPLPALAPIGLAASAAQSGNTRAQTIPCFSNSSGTNTCRLPGRWVPPAARL